MKFVFSLLLVVFFLSHACAQEPGVAVGQWRTHFSNRSANCLAIAANKSSCYVGGDFVLMDLDLNDYRISTLDKVGGLSDVNISQLYYDDQDAKLIAFYQDANIDILQNGNISNYSQIKNSSVIGNKSPQHITSYDRSIYISTEIGLIVFDIEREEVNETYRIVSTGDPNVYSSSVTDNFIYVTSEKGVFRAPKNANLVNFANWVKISPLICPRIETLGADQYCMSENILYKIQDTVFTVVDSIAKGYDLVDMCQKDDKLYMVADSGDNAYGKVYSYSVAEGIKEIKYNHFIFNPKQIEVYAGEIYIADYWQGLVIINAQGEANQYSADGPNSNNFYRFGFRGEDLYATSGGVDRAYNGLFLQEGLKTYNNINWGEVNKFNYPILDTFPDMMEIAFDKSRDYIYIGSWGGGLLRIEPDGAMKIYKEGYLDLIFDGSRITSMQMDPSSNLFMTNYGDGIIHGIVCKTSDDHFIPYPFNRGKGLGKMVLDDAGQIWVVAPKEKNLFCYDPAGTLDNTGDDRYSGPVSGLNGGVNTICLDKDGELWIGTDDGMGLISCPEYFLDGSCKVDLPVVNFDSVINAYLFDDEVIHAIAVDGANRKWVGTENGVWLISPNGDASILQFNTSNSPLPSNKIVDIGVNPVNGEVFIATEGGMVSYRGRATEGVDEDKQKVLVFPNPVPPGYVGNIAFRGLPTDADVKITDADGLLVYKTKAEGGQANWDGYTYTGYKASSGVYFVYVLSSDGSLGTNAKFILLD